MSVDQIKNKIAVTIHEKDPNAVAYLFGSRARGDFKPDSDWDILILVDQTKVSNDIDDKFRDGLYNIEIETGQIISTLIYPKEYWEKTLCYSPLYENVLNEGLKI